jgi:hypothetical protein
LFLMKIAVNVAASVGTSRYYQGKTSSIMEQLRHLALLLLKIFTGKSSIFQM